MGGSFHFTNYKNDIETLHILYFHQICGIYWIGIDGGPIVMNNKQVYHDIYGACTIEVIPIGDKVGSGSMPQFTNYKNTNL